MKKVRYRWKHVFFILMCVLIAAGILLLTSFASVKAATVTTGVTSWQELKNYVGASGNDSLYLIVTGDMTVIGGNAHNAGNDVVIDLKGHTLDANNQQAFWNEKGTMTIKNGTIKNAASDLGGAINNRGTMVLENVNIVNCSAKQGGGILNYGMLTMTGGSIKGCHAGRGGAIRLLPHDSDKSAIAQYATANLTNVELSGNTADGSSSYGRGGAIGVSRGTLTLTGCKLTGNRSTADDGGAIDFDANGKYLTITDTEISGNSVTKSERQGGGINLERGDATIRNCTISGNSAPDGGGIYVAESFGIAAIYGTTIRDNTATTYGGGGVSNHSSVQLTENCVISNNTSRASGAGIWSNRTLQVADSTVSGNTCTGDGDGGGISAAGGTAVLQSVKVTGNKASDGGGINVAAAEVTVSGTSEITGNSAPNSGGGIMNKGILKLQDTVTITGNTCGANGGAIYFNGSGLLLQGKLEIKDNSDNNLFLFAGKTITVTDKIDDSSVIYVTTGSGEQTFTKGFADKGNTNVNVFVHDAHQEIVNDNGEARVHFQVLSGDILDRVTVIIHPAGQNSALNIRDNGRGPGQNVVQLFNTGDSCRFWLTEADDNSYYIDYFDGADDYSPSTKRFDLSDKHGYGNSGNVVHVVKGNSMATNKRWMFVQNADGTYYIQNKRSGLYWDLENNNYDNKNKLCQRALQDAQAWEIEIVAADGGYDMDFVKQYDSFSFKSDRGQVKSNYWMSMLPDDLYITDLSIPGTHDAGAAHTGTCNSSAQCQQLSIYDQLNAGIRYFDLRLGPDLRIVHGATNCQFNGDGLYVDRVMNWIRKFLSENPFEVVILQPMENRGGDKVDKAAYRYFKTLVETEPDLFYIGDHVPTLGECRGKILIISRLGYSTKDYQTEGGQWALEAKNWQTSRLDREYYENFEQIFQNRHYTETEKLASGLVGEGSNYEIWSQDDYGKTGDDKWEVIYNSIFDGQTGAQAKYNWWNREKENKNLWLVAYTSCNDFWAAKYPQDTARNINPRVKNEIMKETSLSNGKFLGVVCTDFVDEQMSYLIYRQNFAMTHVIIHGVTADGKEPFLPMVYNVAKNQPLNETLGLKEKEIDTYFTRSNYATHDYDYKESTKVLCTVPMSRLKNEEEYLAAAVDLGTLRGNAVYELYIGLDTRMNTTQNLLFEAPDCLTEVTGVNGDDWSGQTPRPQFKEAENAHYHIVEENGVPKAYWVIPKSSSIFDDGKREAFTGKLESGKNYGAMVELEADWGYCFATDWLTATAHIIGSDGKTEDTTMDTGSGLKIFPYTVTAFYNKAAVSHDLTHEEAKEAKCAEEGQVENYYCKVCEKHFADETCTAELSEEEITIPVLGHVPQEPKEENRTAPTCTEDGSVEIVSRCSVCGEIVSTKAQTIPETGHDWDEGTVTTAPTCTEPGVMTYTCKNDASHTRTEEIPATGHDWGAWTVDTGAGIEQRVCGNDPGHIQIKDIPDSTHLHSLTHVAAAPAACETDGNIEYWFCSGCGRYYADAQGSNEIDSEDVVLKAFGHEWDAGVVTAAPGCTTAGVRTYTCQHDASHTKEETISPIGHKQGEWVDEVVHEATCMHGKHVWHTLYCGNGCGEILTMQLRQTEEPKDHEWSKPEYTWSEDYTTVMAKRVCTCDPENPHAETETVKVKAEVETPVTCEQDGKSHLTAVFKNKAFEEQTMDLTRPALEHKWDEGVVTKEATCTEDGEMTYTCQNDSTHKKTEVIKATGHVPGRHALPATDTATCTQGGTQTVETVCLTCGEVLKSEQEATQPLGHHWAEPEYNMSASGDRKFMTATHTCTECGATESETVDVITEDFCYYSEPFENVFFEIQEWPLGNGDPGEEEAEVRWTKGSGEDAVFEINRFYEKTAEEISVEFGGLQIDGVKIPESEYTYNCTLNREAEIEKHVAEVKASMMESLSVGTHRITALYRYGEEEKYVSELFEVIDGTTDTPEPSDHIHVLTAVPAKNATYTEDGNIAYWVCDQGEDPCGKYFKDPGCTIEITLEDTVIKAAGDAGTITYRNTSGDGQSWTKGSGKTADFTFKRSVSDEETISHFTGIQVDGRDVAASEYTAVSGSVIVSLKASCLETLSVGSHTITALFDDGNAPAARFTVLAAKAGQDSRPGRTSGAGSSGTTHPGTGDDNNRILWLALLGAAAFGLVMTVWRARRKQYK